MGSTMPKSPVSNAWGARGAYASFMECMWRAVAKGFVRHEDAVFAQQGLRRVLALLEQRN